MGVSCCLSVKPETQADENGAEPNTELDPSGNAEATGDEAGQNAVEELIEDDDDVVIPPSPPGKCSESLIVSNLLVANDQHVLELCVLSCYVTLKSLP